MIIAVWPMKRKFVHLNMTCKSWIKKQICKVKNKDLSFYEKSFSIIPRGYIKKLIIDFNICFTSVRGRKSEEAETKGNGFHFLFPCHDNLLNCTLIKGNWGGG